MKNVLFRKEKDFISCFDTGTGAYMRTGIIRDGKDTGKDPFMASFPELLDVGIMGNCAHGLSGKCLEAGIGCYQDGFHSQNPHMSLEDFAWIVRQCQGNTYQFALGGCGDPDQHPCFEQILKMCRDNGIVPNYTTSGFGMTERTAALSKQYCGAAAVSWYRNTYTDRAIQMLLGAGVKTNIHYVLSVSTVDEALQRLRFYSAGSREEHAGFPAGINAVIFLLHKSVGMGREEEVITSGNQEFAQLLELVDQGSFPFKIGFDSCTVPALLHLPYTDPDSLDTCEGARWSAYISPDMKMMPCSFDNQKARWAVDLRTYSIREAWNSQAFEDFRNYFRTACPECGRRNACLGGCPIVPDIVLCGEENRLQGRGVT